jgi:folylpolyglutamate synthase/dihydropteroate synthase
LKSLPAVDKETRELQFNQAGADAKRESVTPVKSALARALELSSKDGSFVLSAGSMFVTAEVMKEWNKKSAG